MDIFIIGVVVTLAVIAILEACARARGTGEFSSTNGTPYLLLVLLRVILCDHIYATIWNSDGTPPGLIQLGECRKILRSYHVGIDDRRPLWAHQVMLLDMLPVHLVHIMLGKPMVSFVDECCDIADDELVDDYIEADGGLIGDSS